MGSNQGCRRNIQGIGRQHQVGFVIRKKLQHRRHDRPIGEVIAQHFRGQPGQRQQPFCARRIAKHPRKGRQCQRFRIAG